MKIGWGQWKTFRRGRKAWCSSYICLDSPFVIGTDCVKIPQQKVCYRTGGETQYLYLEEWKERWRSAVNLLASLGSIACGFQGVPVGVGGWDLATSREKKAWRGRSVGSQRWSRCSVAEWDETGLLTWGNRGRGQDLQIAYLLPWLESILILFYYTLSFLIYYYSLDSCLLLTWYIKGVDLDRQRGWRETWMSRKGKS